MTLVWSVRDAAAFTDWLPGWLASLARRGAALELHSTGPAHAKGSRAEEEGWSPDSLRSGRPDYGASIAALAARAPGPRLGVFACGPPAMVHAAAAAAAGAGAEWAADVFGL